MKTIASSITVGFPKVYHWTHNAKGKLMLHPGDAEKCRRVHRDQRGNK